MDNAIHDIANKVTIILGQVGKQERDGSGDWSKVRIATDKIVEIIRDSRRSNELACVKQAEATEFAIAWAKTMKLLYGVEVGVEMEPGKQALNPDDYVFNDNRKMDSIFTNAVENAIKGGATKFTLRAHRAKHYTEYALYDNGRGMTQEQIDSLGFGFTQGGTGEGTRFMRRTLVEMGGTATWESTVGVGTVFRARVPNGPAAAVTQKLAA
jgi:signal transduction histidine kinase